MESLRGIRRILFYLFEVLAVTTFLVMLGSSILQVFFRYVLDMPLQWTEELARLMCVLTTYFGSIVVILAREHIRVDLVDGLMSGRPRQLLNLFVDLLIAWFLVSVAYGCWLLMNATWTTYTATMDWFRMGYIYAAVGVSMAVMTFLVVLDMYDRVLALAAGGKEGRA